MSAERLPEPWGTPLEVKGVTTIRGLARAADIGPMAASRLIKGQGTSVETVNAVAKELFNGDRNRVWQLYGAGVKDHGDFRPPAEASLLTPEQRDAVNRVIRAMLPAEVRTGGAGVPRRRQEPPKARPGPSEQGAAIGRRMKARSVPEQSPPEPRGDDKTA